MSKAKEKVGLGADADVTLSVYPAPKPLAEQLREALRVSIARSVAAALPWNETFGTSRPGSTRSARLDSCSRSRCGSRSSSSVPNGEDVPCTWRRSSTSRGRAAEAAALLADDALLCDLFPDTRNRDRRAQGHAPHHASHYTALGREGIATFHFDFEPSGDVRFEKVCDGRVWRELRGVVKLTERKDKTRVRIEMDGRTKALVPEFTIRGPMQDQIEQMAKALKRRLAAKA